RHKINVRHAIGRFRLSLSGGVNAVTTAFLYVEMGKSRLAEVHTALGKALAQQGDSDAAAAAFTQAFKLGDERQVRYVAACTAALAATGQNSLADAAKAKLRRQALDWLKAELIGWTKLLESVQPQDRLNPDRLKVVQALSLWQQDSDLAGIRDA